MKLIKVEALSEKKATEIAAKRKDCIGCMEIVYIGVR